MPYKDPEKQKEYQRQYQREYAKTHREQTRARGSKYAASHPDEIRERRKVHRLANLESERERNRAYSKQWRIEHPDYGTQWRLANADKVKQNNERWQTDHPEIMGAHSRRRYARKVGAPVVEFVERLVVAERDGWICQLCGDPIDRMLAYRNPTTGRLDPGYLHIDHIIPLSKGGEHTYANTQATHARCNQRKHNKIAD